MFGDHWGTSTIVSHVLALNQAFRKKDVDLVDTNQIAKKTNVSTYKCPLQCSAGGTPVVPTPIIMMPRTSTANQRPERVPHLVPSHVTSYTVGPRFTGMLGGKGFAR
eukprot:sb/3477700/